MLFSPIADQRYGAGQITSRLGIQRESNIISLDNINELKDVLLNNKDNKFVILVDECQFVDEYLIDKLNLLNMHYNVPILFYGLKNNSQGKLFGEGISKILAVADKIVEIKTLCFCGAKATQNLKYNDSFEPILDGDVVDLGAEEKYISVCRQHFYMSAATIEELIRREIQ